MLKPLLWKILEKSEKDDIWPKHVMGASLIYCDDIEKYVLIGGNFNAYENLIKNFSLNSGLINAIDNNVENFQKVNAEKISFLTDNIYNNQEKKTIDTYFFETKSGIKNYNF